MVVPNPPSYFGFTYDSSISNKPKEEMTTDEYKQWFMNEMSKMPVSSWFRSSFSSGSLVIKEEAFERMKNDPEYEKYVMNRIRSMYSVSSLPVGPNNVCRINARSCGTLRMLHVPGGPSVRFDTCLVEGTAVSPYYDSLLGKLIVFAGTREEALRKLRANNRDAADDFHRTLNPVFKNLDMFRI